MFRRFPTVRGTATGFVGLFGRFQTKYVAVSKVHETQLTANVQKVSGFICTNLTATHRYFRSSRKGQRVSKLSETHPYHRAVSPGQLYFKS